MNKPLHGMRNVYVPPKLSPSTSGLSTKATVEHLRKQIALLTTRLDRRNIKVSKAAET